MKIMILIKMKNGTNILNQLIILCNSINIYYKRSKERLEYLK